MVKHKIDAAAFCVICVIVKLDLFFFLSYS